MIRWFGWIGTSLSIIYRLPQIYRLYQTQKGEDLSGLSYGTQSLSYICYGLHGMYIQDLPILCMSIAALVQNIIILTLRRRYRSPSVERIPSETPT